jgi:hypothetical protein
MDQKQDSKVATMQQRAISAAVLKAFFEGNDAKAVAAKVAATEASRLNYLFAMFPNSGLDDVKTAVKEYKAQAKEQYGDKAPEVKSAQNRAGDVQNLYGAFRWAGFKPDGMGYQAACEAARAILREKKIRWTGEKVAEKWERDISREVERNAQVERAARLDAERMRRNGEEVSEEVEQQLREKHAEQQERAGMIALAGGLVRKYGIEKAQWLIEALEGAIAAAQQEAREKKAA